MESPCKCGCVNKPVTFLPIQRATCTDIRYYYKCSQCTNEYIRSRNSMLSFRRICSRVSKRYAKGKLSTTEEMFNSKYLIPNNWIMATCDICLLNNSCNNTPDIKSHICYAFVTSKRNVWIHNYPASLTDENNKIHHYRIDCYIPILSIGLELDGGVWHSLWGIEEKDRYRDKLLKNIGIQIYRITDKEVINGIKQEVLELLCNESKDRSRY